ncbi:hypothetical protein [Acidisphaera sp. L21]|uniref:hypothetical protein n=1 Tax=Acidisphaera sp. L21 TaxID=1641851 RepID=UPI00131CE1FD|nr:hypothetical protein [Acidisphaera sp. L21]
MAPDDPPYQPTPLDIALAKDPSAEAASREVKEASQPPAGQPSDWPQLDQAARDLADGMTEGRKQLIRRTTFPPLADDE